jgi:hypothetical protein
MNSGRKNPSFIDGPVRRTTVVIYPRYAGYLKKPIPIFY